MKARIFTRETIRELGMYDRPFQNIEVGSTVAVSQRIKEGDKERIQIFEGDVIAISNNGPSSTFTVRKIGANSISVERIFPFYSPLIENVRFVKKGKIRRAKLYYMRDRIGKAARVEEKVLTKEQKAREYASHHTPAVGEKPASAPSQDDSNQQ